MAAVDKLVDQQHILRSCEIKCKCAQMASSSPPPEPGSARPPPPRHCTLWPRGVSPAKGLQLSLWFCSLSSPRGSIGRRAQGCLLASVAALCPVITADAQLIAVGWTDERMGGSDPEQSPGERGTRANPGRGPLLSPPPLPCFLPVDDDI